MSFFFHDYIKANTAFGQGLYRLHEMHDCWIGGQFSVMKFVEIGGSLGELKDILEAYKELELRLEKLGMIGETKHNIRKVIDERKKIQEERKSLNGKISKVVRSKIGID